MIAQRHHAVLDRASLTEYSRSLTHDLNNLLGIMMRELLSLRHSDRLNSNDRDKVARLEALVIQQRDYINQLVDFGDLADEKLRPLNVMAFLWKTRDLLPGDATRISLFFPTAVRDVLIPECSLNRVVMNLIVNACQAMHGGGRVEVTGADLTLAADNDLGLDSGPYVRLSVADDGPGIAPAILPEIFKPGFTTKVGGRGIGLFASKKLLNKYGGTMTVESLPGKGATVHLFLKAALPSAETQTRDRPVLQPLILTDA